MTLLAVRTIRDTRGDAIAAARDVAERLTRRPPERDEDRAAVKTLSRALAEYERTLR